MPSNFLSIAMNSHIV